MKLTSAENLRETSAGKSNDLSQEILASADNARDSRKWELAAELYAKYLTTNPSHVAIWIQCGNCAKEAKKLNDALFAYNEALKLDPDDSECHLQLGHLMKVQGKRRRAIDCYKRALELDPSNTNAQRELRALGISVAAYPGCSQKALDERSPAIFMDIFDVVNYLRAHLRCTGIQRVLFGIVHECLNQHHQDVFFGIVDRRTREFLAFEKEPLQDLIETVISGEMTRSELDICLDEVEQCQVRFTLKEGDIFFIGGAFWIGEDYSHVISYFKSSKVITGVYIYDLIPFTHPQFVEDSTRRDVLRSFSDILGVVDFCLTISEYVAREVSAFLISELQRKIPVEAVTLAHTLPLSGTFDRSLASQEVKNICEEEFVLCVCTLEGRKNHILLLRAWLTLFQKHGGKLPKLVLVGKWGWRIDEFRRELALTHNVNGRILTLGNVSDVELEQLYSNCLFTVFPSFVEGWGLPVGESLAYGKPCIASNATSIPEVGGEFVKYFNPYEQITATSTIEDTLFSRRELERWTTDIKENFKPRSWGEVSTVLLTTLQSMREAIHPEPHSGICAIEPGVLFRIGREAEELSNFGAKYHGMHLVLWEGWHQVEEWGAWSASRDSKVYFRVPYNSGRRIKVLIELRLPPLNTGIVVISQASEEPQTARLSDEIKWLAFDGRVEEHGLVKLSFARVDEAQQANSKRPLYVGLSSIGVYAFDDYESRLNIVEELLLQRRS